MPIGTVRRRLRLGMIGGGAGSLIGPIHRLAARMDDRYALIAGAFSSVGTRSAEAGISLHIEPSRCYADWREMVREEAARGDDRLDAVAIVTPNHLHAAPVLACLDAGFHVICDKPLAASLAEAQAIAAAVERSGGIFALTHNYSAYPMVRQMRAMIAAGAVGTLRLIESEYAQDWLTLPLEAAGHRQASWRTDPARAGAGGALGDIGTHAYHLATFVTGRKAETLCADLTAFGEGRLLDDNAHMLLRFEGGVRGLLWASQVAPGQSNGHRLRIYGSAGGLEWEQEHPDQLRYTPFGAPTRILERGGAVDHGTPAAAYATRLPGGHPEGFLEAFAQLYSDVAEQIVARIEQREPAPSAMLVPGIADGLEGMRFIAGAVESSRRRAWLAREDWDAAAT